MLSRILSGLIPGCAKSRLKSLYATGRARYVKLFRSYGVDDLENHLTDLGIRPGDAIIVHSGFKTHNGFRGRPQDVIKILLELVGESGHVVMMSMAYTGAAISYLTEEKPFDPNRTISRMGLISEIFRRRRGVRRSRNPVHPILAFGLKAEWIVEGHERLVYSCGEGSPFERLLEMDAKVLLFDVHYLSCTFLHFLEHHFRNVLDLEVYHPSLIATKVIDMNREVRPFETFVFNPKTVRARDEVWMELRNVLLNKSLLLESRLGNTSLALVRTGDLYREAAEHLGTSP